MNFRKLLLLITLIIVISFTGCGLNKIKLVRNIYDSDNKRKHGKKTYLDDYEVVDRDQEYMSTYYENAKNSADKDRYNKAISELNNAINLNPNNADAYINRGKTHAKQGEHNKAILDYSRAIDINPNSDEAYINRGRSQASNGEHNKAISDYSKAIETNPNNVEANIERGKIYTSQGKHSKAISDYSNAIKINPDSADAYIHQGKSHSRQGENNKAILDYTRAKEINSDLVDIHINYGKPFKVYSKTAASYFVRGQKLMQANHYKEAILAFDKAIELDEDFPEAFLNRGTIYWAKYMSNKLPSADTNTNDKLSSLSKEYKDHETFHYNKDVSTVIKGVIFHEKDLISLAISDFSNAILLNPKSAIAYYNRGSVYLVIGQINKVILDWNKSFEINPEHIESYANSIHTDGSTPLYWASYNGHTALVKLLLEAGADVNKAHTDGFTPLYVASYKGNTEIVKLLLEAKADINAYVEFDGKKWTALSLAKARGHTHIVSLLIKYGANE
ncbi:MAG: tetratricopeptide repeat protein [Deltaproteobacteria bacterium]|nr:tetratricopeptide repeat protein [Deltaproteobacteria bacterium]